MDRSVDYQPGDTATALLPPDRTEWATFTKLRNEAAAPDGVPHDCELWEVGPRQFVPTLEFNKGLTPPDFIEVAT